jgi:hypothetical protein
MSKTEKTLSQWEGTFVVLESNRRLSSSLLQEAAHTSKLTRWVVGLTIAMAALTVLLAAFSSVDPAKNWRAVDEAMRTGIYGPS